MKLNSLKIAVFHELNDLYDAEIQIEHAVNESLTELEECLILAKTLVA